MVAACGRGQQLDAVLMVWNLGFQELGVALDGKDDPDEDEDHHDEDEDHHDEDGDGDDEDDDDDDDEDDDGDDDDDDEDNDDIQKTNLIEHIDWNLLSSHLSGECSIASFTCLYDLKPCSLHQNVFESSINCFSDCSCMFMFCFPYHCVYQ